MLENYKVITQIWQPQIHTHFAVKSFSSHSFALKIIIQTLLFQNIAKKIPSGHKCCKDGAREIWPIWHLRWMDKRMALCVISSVLLRFIWPRPQESNTFTGHSMKRRLHTTRSHAPIAVPSSIRRAADIRKHTAGKVRSQKSGALKRSSDKAWYFSLASGGTAYAAWLYILSALFRKTNISDTRLGFCNLDGTFKGLISALSNQDTLLKLKNP